MPNASATKHKARFEISAEYIATSVNKIITVLHERCVLKAVKVRIDASSGASGTISTRHVDPGEAVASGTAFHLAQPITGAANSVVTPNITVDPATLIFDPGDAIGVVFGGTLSPGRGRITIELERV